MATSTLVAPWRLLDGEALRGRPFPRLAPTLPAQAAPSRSGGVATPTSRSPDPRPSEGVPSPDEVMVLCANSSVEHLLRAYLASEGGALFPGAASRPQGRAPSEGGSIPAEGTGVRGLMAYVRSAQEAETLAWMISYVSPERTVAVVPPYLPWTTVTSLRGSVDEVLVLSARGGPRPFPVSICGVAPPSRAGTR